MKAFFQKIHLLLLPLSWTLLTIILLCLPGSVIPGAGIFATNNLDKIVHFILFGGIVLLWGLYIRKTWSPAMYIKTALGATLFSIALGIVLEYVQRYFISNRTFDTRDILADAAGAVTMFIILIITRNNVARNKKPL